MNKDGLKISIQMKPYLQEYVTGRMENNVNNSYKELLGAVINPFLEKAPRDWVPSLRKEPGKIDIHLVLLHFPTLMGMLFLF